MEKSKKHLVSVVLSFRNEQDVLLKLINRLQKVLNYINVDYELIFVNDNSTDNSLQVLKGIESNKHIKVINMSQRFGVVECTLAGIRYAKGDAVIYMDADLQDPPEVIPQLFGKYLQGADVVYTVRTKREGESIIKMILTKMAYKVIKFTSNINLIPDAGDFRLLSRRAVNELLKLNEKTPYLRGLVSWIGLKQVPVFYQRKKRSTGRTHFPLTHLFSPDISSFHGAAGTFINGIISFSILPLLFFLFIGIILCLCTFISFIIVFIFGLELSNLLIIIFVLSLMSGIQLLGIGTIGLYLYKIYIQVRNRPDYIIESTKGFEDDFT